jgi:hypothetical protein
MHLTFCTFWANPDRFGGIYLGTQPSKWTEIGRVHAQLDAQRFVGDKPKKKYPPQNSRGKK